MSKRPPLRLLWGSVLCVLACAKPVVPPQKPPDRAACSLVPGPAQEGGSVLVALSEPVDPAHAPVPHNGSERLLFQHFYETLVRVDCAGGIVPGLAAAWQSQAGGRRWLFTLRDGARFWDGSPLRAAHVVACWQDRRPSHAMTLPWDDPDAVRALDARRLQVTLAQPRPHVPREFADPALSVTRQPDFSGWPVGTGPHRPSGPVEESHLGGTRRTITAYPVTPASWTVLRFRLAPGMDPRRLLDEGVDLLITDRLSFEEARGWPGFDTRLLPWQRTYVVTSPMQRTFDALVASFPATQRDALARDVLRVPARGAAPPSWWDAADPCGLAFSPPSPRTPAPTVAYDETDPHGRALAERVVALAADSLRVVPLPPAAFAAAAQVGSERVYVLAVPSHAGSPCAEAQALLQRLPWLLRRGRTWTGGGWTWSPAHPRSAGIGELSLEKRLLPLVETRPLLMSRQGLVGIGMGAHASVRLEKVGWSRPGGAP